MSPIRVAAWAFTDAGTGPAASMARVGGKPTQAPLMHRCRSLPPVIIRIMGSLGCLARGTSTINSSTAMTQLYGSRLIKRGSGHIF